ncbi:MAG: phosphate/phosphite/phosphonate ABC transporter substrate-binding protein [Pseudomonadota bacterium]
MARILVLAHLALMLLLGANPSQASKAVYTLAVVPQFTTVDIAQRWTPLLDRIAQETGVRFQIRTSHDIPSFESEFLNGIPDFVFLNPYHMVMAAKAQSYVPLIRSRRNLSGILVVGKNSPVTRVADLDGATIAFPAPNAFGASLYMRALLSEQEKLVYTANYVGTHQNTYRHVIFGDAQAGGGVASTLESESPGVREQLRVLYHTPEAPSHPLAAHPRVPKAVIRAVVTALQRMDHDAAGRALLKQVELEGAVAAHYDRDYAPLEKLNLERYVVRRQR